MPKKTCADSIETVNATLSCAFPDPERRGNHRDSDGHKWANDLNTFPEPPA